MHWFLVRYFVNGGAWRDFACVRVWNRREAYFEVTNDIHEVTVAEYGSGVRIWWDTVDDIGPGGRNHDAYAVAD